MLMRKGKYMERGDKKVESSRKIRKKDMERMIEKKIEKMIENVIEKIEVEKIGKGKSKIKVGKEKIKEEIGNESGENEEELKEIDRRKDLGDERNEMVEIDEGEVLIEKKKKIRIEIERDKKIGEKIMKFINKEDGMSREEIIVDIDEIRIVVDGNELREKLKKRRRRKIVKREIREIEKKEKKIERDVERKCEIGKLDIEINIEVKEIGEEKIEMDRKKRSNIELDNRIDMKIDMVRKIEEIGEEKIDEVIVEGIMRRGNNKKDIREKREEENGEGRGRDREKKEKVNEGRGKKGKKRFLKNIEGEECIIEEKRERGMKFEKEDIEKGNKKFNGDLRCNRKDVWM